MLVDLGLLSKPQTSNCRPAAGETIGKAKACWAGGTVQIYLNVAGPRPAPPRRVPAGAAADVPATVAAIKAAFLALSDPNDWTGDGQPEGWKVIDRAFTQAEARYIPNGPDTTADMAHPTRTGDLVVFAYPPYQFDAATPGTLVARRVLRPARLRARRAGPRRQHQHAGDFLAGGDGDHQGRVHRPVDRHRADRRLPAGGAEPQQSQGKVLLDVLEDGRRVQAAHHHRAQRLPRPARPDDALAIDGLDRDVGGAAQLATMFDEEATNLPGPTLLLAGGDNVGASPPNSALLEDKPTIDVENAWGLDATSYGNHEFDYGVARLLQQQAQAHFPFLATNIVDETDRAGTGLGHAVEGVQGQRRQGRRDRRRRGNDAGTRRRRQHRRA